MKRLLIYTFAMLIVTSCSTMKHIPENEVLYIGIEDMEFVDADKNATTETGETAIAEVTSALECAPNGSIAGSSSLRGFPFGLWWYNSFYNSKKGFGKWFFDTFATEPVLMSAVKPELRAEVANDILKYYGYFNGKVEAKIIPSKKNNRKAKVSYKITLNEPYTYDSISYTGFTGVADSLIQATAGERLIAPGEQFNAALMEAERDRISGMLRNNGYYYFQPAYITFLADTVNIPGKAQMRVQPVKQTPKQALHTWVIGDINLTVTGNSPTGNSQIRAKSDTISRRGFSYIYQGEKMPVKIGSLLRNIRLRKGELYSNDKQQSALQGLSQMNIFSNINFTPSPRTGSDTLDLGIRVQLDKPYDFAFELNATSKSNDQIGPGTKISLSRRNIFRGGELLKLTLKGSYEWQTDKKVKGRSAVINSWEMGADLSLSFPRLFFPIIHSRYLRVPSSTSLRIFTDQMNRSGFFRMIQAGGDATYKIFSSSTTTHTVVPFRLSYDMLLSTTEKFDSIVATNRSIENSFRNQFIPAMQYTFTYDNAGKGYRNSTWLEASVTSAGNITSLIFAAFGKSLSEKDKNILGNPYAQFVKATAELRNLWKISSNHQIATRIMLGGIHSYGNAEYAPYSEQFYIGGANSLRAFTVRSVGPGSYRPSSDNRYSYLDETGTLKLEMNAEYRFRLISDLHGAIFVDAGNIWLLKKDPDRPGGEFKINRFAEQLALNTGFGVRYDLEFLVLRIDFGLGLHAPYKTRRNGYFNLNPFKDGFAWHFAIGYPF